MQESRRNQASAASGVAYAYSRGAITLLNWTEVGLIRHGPWLFYDYRTNVEAYPKWHDWMREKQRIWGKYESSFDPSEPKAYRRDVPKAEAHIVDCGHFALDTVANEIAQLVRGFMK